MIMIKYLNLIKLYLKEILKYIFWFCYYHFFIPFKKKKIRKKERINVLFLVAEISIWKTEALYNAMLKHPRFRPIIAITPALSANYSINSVKEYMDLKNYSYEDISTDFDLQKQFAPDIIFYQKGWYGHLDPRIEYSKNLKSLLCYAMYSFHNSHVANSLGLPLYNFCWQLYYENDLASKDVSKFMINKGSNIVVTGLPMMDRNIKEIKENNPWKDEKRKRIIYAPHFAVSNGLFNNATFLSTGEMMLEIAKKYSSEVYWVFKPHPLLQIQLYDIWGKEKTDTYYDAWVNFSFSHIELGTYDSLFFYSDALIHDCMSFIVEYQYSMKPALYLLSNTDVTKSINEFTKKAYDLHYKSTTREDIEKFINMIIFGGDDKQQQREEYVKTQLTPPNGKSACDNIINAILGIEEYKNK